LTTLFTTTVMGAWQAYDFAHNQPAFSGDDLTSLGRLFRSPRLLLDGLPFSLTLLGILMAHELGHYIACAYYRVDATLPFFLPAPTPIGTLGAFIKIHSPISFKRDLFDIGVAGPLAGFLFLLPAFAIGIAYSKVVPGLADGGDLVFDRCLLERGLAALIHPGVEPQNIYLHPVARAAWVGALATALNLLPIGQLDGGHILYAFFGKGHRWLSRLFVLALVPLGLRYSMSWLVWAAFLFLFGLRHPAIYDDRPLGSARIALGVLALVIFAVCFTLTPLRIVE
jgi:membrane-associated protease RseP (regulator of RpoE activity)